jgi:hypothetical protein
MKLKWISTLFFALAIVAFITAPSAQMPFSWDFEDVDSAAYASRPNDDEFTAGTGGLTNIGKGTTGQNINRAGRFGVAHSGSRAARITFNVNEQEARARRNHINSDSVLLRMWLYFDNDYDHAFGEKLFRISSIDSVADGQQYFDLIGYMRCSGDAATSGKDNMAVLGLEPNGGSGDFGSVSISFPRNEWFEFAIKMVLHAPGASNGRVTVWYNGDTVHHRNNLSNMRTSGKGGGYNHLTDNYPFTYVSPFGWYSNGSGGNPNVPAIKYVDDICIGRNFTECPSLVGGGGSVPVIITNPMNKTVIAKRTATFSILATGATSYQWQRGSTNVSNGSGGTTATYTTARTSRLTDNNATFRCIAINEDGADTSTAATLTVRPNAPASSKSGGKQDKSGGTN